MPRYLVKEIAQVTRKYFVEANDEDHAIELVYTGDNYSEKIQEESIDIDDVTAEEISPGSFAMDRFREQYDLDKVIKVYGRECF